MTPNLSFDVEWSPSEYGPAEITQTSAFLQIGLGENVATRIEDDWSQSVHNRIRLSLYPMAVWLASSWWRLRWEPAPYSGVANVGWRMAHELAAAGNGSLWPRLTFTCDGEMVEANCEASNPLSREPVRYLANFIATVGASEFERSIDDFMSLVLARLDTLGVTEKILHDLWKEVLEERKDEELATLRKFEAQLGFEVDEAPEEIIESLCAVSRDKGDEAAEEIAPVCAGDNPLQSLQRIFEFAESPGADGRIELPRSLSAILTGAANESVEPWKRGCFLATEARRTWGLGENPVPDSKIEELLQIPNNTIAGERSFAVARLPMGLAIRDNGTNKLKLLFRKRNRPGARFEAARFIVSHLLASRRERWLPATDAKTARQKVQRAFAAEFLCPFDALEAFLDGDFSPEAIEEAGTQFGVSELAIKSHLANHGKIPAGAVVA
jgi:hypothetical protein